MNKRSLSVGEIKLFKKLNLKVFLGIPIVVGGEVLGALHSGKVADPLPFTVSQIKLCQTIANQVGIALRNAKLVNDLKNRCEQQKLLLEISQSLFQSLSTQRLLDIMIRETCKALKMDRSGIAMFEPKDAHSVVRSVYFRRRPESGTKNLLSTDYLGQVFRTASFKQLCEELEKGERKYLLAEDVLSAASSQKARKYYRAAGVKSALIVPVFSDRTLVGLLNVGTVKDYHTFTDSEIQICQTIANLASLALENASLMDRVKDQSESIRKQLKEEAILLDISRALSRTLNLQDLLKIVTRKAAELLRIERVAAVLVEESTGDLFSQTIFYRGRHQTEIEGAPENIKDFPILMNCVRTKQLFCASDISRTKISLREMDYFKRREVKSVLDIPFALGHRILGILALNTVKEYHEFTQSEIRLSQSIANQLS